MSNCDQCGSCGCDEQIKVFRFSHPNWDMKLIIDEASGGRQIALDFLCEEDDPNLLTSEAVTMTKDEYENLTEWYG